MLGDVAASERCRTDDLEEYGFGGVAEMGLGRRWAGMGENEFVYED